MCESGLDSATEMDMVQREEFLAWAVNKFLLLPGKSVPDESYDESLLRFWREQERRVGSFEMFEALSYTRLLEPQDVRNAFKEDGRLLPDRSLRPVPKMRFCMKPRRKHRSAMAESGASVGGSGAAEVGGVFVGGGGRGQ